MPWEAGWEPNQQVAMWFCAAPEAEPKEPHSGVCGLCDLPCMSSHEPPTLGQSLCCPKSSAGLNVSPKCPRPVRETQGPGSPCLTSSIFGKAGDHLLFLWGIRDFIQVKQYLNRFEMLLFYNHLLQATGVLL